MFILLLLIDLILAVTISYLVIKIFDKSISGIIKKVVPEDISTGWILFLKLAIYLVGVSGGVNMFKLEEFLNIRSNQPLSYSYFFLELYRIVFETLKSIAWLLLAFFIVALIAYFVAKTLDIKKDNHK